MDKPKLTDPFADDDTFVVFEDAVVDTTIDELIHMDYDIPHARALGIVVNKLKMFLPTLFLSLPSDEFLYADVSDLVKEFIRVCVNEVLRMTGDERNKFYETLRSLSTEKQGIYLVGSSIKNAIVSKKRSPHLEPTKTIHVLGVGFLVGDDELLQIIAGLYH
ncbi:MAG: hypothetical protein KatS3mg087_0488 [Patescibacteria group bacterium]|nr:MAG: hypothetical protein KatS3mg087_0488 [Patescibacteria group bacterium]